MNSNGFRSKRLWPKSKHFPEATEENHGKLLRRPVSLPRFESNNSRIRVSSLFVTPIRSVRGCVDGQWSQSLYAIWSCSSRSSTARTSRHQRRRQYCVCDWYTLWASLAAHQMATQSSVSLCNTLLVT
jgi:hypothetical protein